MTDRNDAYPVFHLYNQSNDRKDLFAEDRNYRSFLEKIGRQMPAAAEVLGYCLMPNHFHLLVTPKHPIRFELAVTDKPWPAMPTRELSEAIRRILMGYTRGYNNRHGLTGSRFRQHTKCRYHDKGLGYGLRYLHRNPLEAKMVDHPAEWFYSSFNEYAGFIDPEDCVCNVTLGRQLLADFPFI